MYDLSASHHCPLLSFAIQLVMKEGHEDEVANIGGPLANYFMVRLPRHLCMRTYTVWYTLGERPLHIWSVGWAAQ